MEAKEMALNNAESLTEELSDEELTDCVGGSGWILKEGGAPVRQNKKGKFFVWNEDEWEKVSANKVMWDPNGSTRATRR